MNKILTKNNYETPALELIEIDLEKGFAESGSSEDADVTDFGNFWF